MFKAIKNAANAETQNLVKQLKQANQELQKLTTQLTLKDRKLRREMNSWNYKIGSAVTFLPKKLYYLFKKAKK